jgi:hypothetical protein
LASLRDRWKRLRDWAANLGSRADRLDLTGSFESED